MEDMGKNCAKCGKGFKTGTKEAKHKDQNQGQAISRIFCFCSYANIM